MWVDDLSRILRLVSRSTYGLPLPNRSIGHVGRRPKQDPKTGISLVAGPGSLEAVQTSVWL